MRWRWPSKLTHDVRGARTAGVQKGKIRPEPVTHRCGKICRKSTYNTIEDR
jgi:hypothetical protein